MKKTLLLLFFVATLCSQSAMDAVSILMTVVFLASIFREGRAQWLKSFKALAMGNEKWFLGFLVSLTVSFVFFAPNLDHFVFRLLELKWYLFIYVLIWFFRDLTLTTREKKIVFSLLLVSSLWAVLIWFLKFDPIHPQDEMSPWAGGIRTGGLLGNSMTFAHLYGIYFCVLTVFLFYRRFSGERGLKLEWATFVSLGAALILSFTRGVWIALIVAFLFFIFAAFKNRATLRNQLALAIFIVAATVVGVLPGVRERIVRGIESGDERSLIWRGHFEIFKSHPVFGGRLRGEHISSAGSF